MSKDFLERPVILDQHQIEDLLLHLGAHHTKIQGNNVQSSHCMLHHNDSPTLGVGLDAPHPYNCFSCHKKGPDIVALVQAVKKFKERHDAYAFLAERYQIGDAGKFSLQRKVDLHEQRPRFTIPHTALSAYPLDADNNIGYRACEYYLGIGKADADRFHLGYRRKDHRLVFPIYHSDGALAGLVGRCMLKKCSHADRWRNFDAQAFKKEFVLLGAELPTGGDEPIIVVEGPRDLFKLRSLGCDRVRSTLGTEFSEWQADTLASYGVPLVPIFDEDRGGDVARKRFMKMLAGKVPILSYKFPPSAIDPVTGKGDPAMLTKQTLVELRSSFRRAFNFARMSRLALTPS